MKCFRFGQSLVDHPSLKDHYVTFLNVDENNHFLRKLFTRDNVFVPRKYFHCEYFCLNGRDKKKQHTFLSHYQMGGRQPVEDKPLKKTFFDENLQRYCVSFIEHGTHYNFYNSRELVSDFFDFLKICLFQELTLGRSASNVPLEMWIVNLPPGLGLLKLPTAEFAQTNVYDGVYFNFIKFKLVSTRHFEKGYYEWHDWWQLET